MQGEGHALHGMTEDAPSLTAATIMCAPSAMAATGERCAKDGWRTGHMRKGERTQKPGDKDWTEGNGHTGSVWLRCCHTLADY